jgi:hypothetical protein
MDLQSEAARHLAEAVASLQKPGQRERHRQLLDGAIDHATRALALVESARARSILAKAYAAKAEDALHGARQLSLSAQRAPSRAACDEGWGRVETIVAGAEALARAAASVANEAERLEPASTAARAARAAAHRAEAAALAARGLVEGRNHAYTFHTDGGFSFGEGWYLAAAAVLAGAAIQIEPGKSGVLAAETFLRDAGLSSRLVPYRSRPRAMKHVPELVARAFEADPASAERRLRAAFLGGGPVSEEVRAWVDVRVQSAHGAPRARKVLVWIRDGVHHPGRNTTRTELVATLARVQEARLVPILVGDALRGEPVPAGALDLMLFWKEPLFQRADTRRAQLELFEHLRERHGLVGQLGVTTAGMDGPALMGLPTLYLTDAPNTRMRQWVGTVPGYRELVREPGYLERLSGVLSDWAERSDG